MLQAMRLKAALPMVVGIIVAAVAVGSASADPSGAKNSLPVTLDCGSGLIDTVTNGNGGFTPTHDLDSTGVYIPVEFGPQTGVSTPPGGPPEPFSDSEFLHKGSANPQGKTILDCTFHVDVTFPDGATLVVDGQVSGFVTK